MLDDLYLTVSSYPVIGINIFVKMAIAMTLKLSRFKNYPTNHKWTTESAIEYEAHDKYVVYTIFMIVRLILGALLVALRVFVCRVHRLASDMHGTLIETSLCII